MSQGTAEGKLRFEAEWLPCHLVQPRSLKHLAPLLRRKPVSPTLGVSLGRPAAGRSLLPPGQHEAGHAPCGPRGHLVAFCLLLTPLQQGIPLGASVLSCQRRERVLPFLPGTRREETQAEILLTAHHCEAGTDEEESRFTDGRATEPRGKRTLSLRASLSNA